MIRQAVILCGGLGSRLGDLVKHKPKPLLQVGDRPFIEHLIQEITRYGISEIVLLAGYLGNQFDKYDDQTINHAQIKVLKELSPQGTWGAVVNAQDYLDPYFLLLNGDSWLDYNLSPFLLDHPETVNMIGRVVKNADRFETIEIYDGFVSKIIPRGIRSSGIINSGIYTVNRSLLRSDLAKMRSLENEVLPYVVRYHNVKIEMKDPNAYFIDIGIPQDYERAKTELIRHRTKPALFADRDNCLTYDRAGYTHLPEDLEFKPGARELIDEANKNGWYVFVVSNQAGVTKGKFEEHFVIDFFREMQYYLAMDGNHIDAFEYETSLESERRKPGPGMLLDLMKDWLVDKSQSFMIGDKDSDVEAGIRAGIKAFKCTDQNLHTQFGGYIGDS